MSREIFTENDTLRSSTTLPQLFTFLTKTMDGFFSLTLSALYFVWASILILGPSNIQHHTGPLFSIGALLMPMVFILTFFRHRVGTSVSDSKPVLFSIASNLALALAPVYIYFWK